MLYIIPLLGLYGVNNKKSLKVILWSIIFITIYWDKTTISTIFVWLTLLIIPTSLLSSWSNVKYNKRYYWIIILTLESILLKFFSTKNIIVFYVTFEISLIPLYLIIKIKLSRKRIKDRATTLLFIYTLIGSLLILSSTTILITLNINIMIDYIIDIWNNNTILWLLLFVGLTIKIPIVPFHIWLFRAHAEAPVSVSIILSSVILKIATYGLFKLLWETLMNTSLYIIDIIEIIIIISLIYTSLSATRQHDMKSLVAISSISHQAIVIIGIFSSLTLALTDNNKLGLYGALLLSISHGLVSPGLFIITGSVLYDRYHSRVIIYYKSLNKYIPLFTTIILLLTLINLGIPLTLNFYGEIFSIITIVKSNIVYGLLSTTTIILSALYSIMLWSKLNLGSNSVNLYFVFDLNRREFVLLIILIMLVLLTGIWPNMLLITIQ